jgi:hypothetical protein
MNPRSEHVSPDGLLRLIVKQADGLVSIGFEGYPSHTHPEVLSAEYQFWQGLRLTPDQAAARFLAEILESRAVIAVARVDGQIRDVWVTFRPNEVLTSKYVPPNEEIELRFWDGKPWHAT